MGCFGSKEKADSGENSKVTVHNSNSEKPPAMSRNINYASHSPTSPIPPNSRSENVVKTSSTRAKKGDSTIGKASRPHAKSDVGVRGSARRPTSSTVGKSSAKSSVGTSSKSAGQTIRIAAMPSGIPIGNFDMVFGSVGELSSAVFGAVKTLCDAGDIKSFPKSIRQGGLGRDWVNEVDPKLYAEAFRTDQRGKISAIAAVVSLFLWDSIEEYKFFDEPAIKALKEAQRLYNEPDIPLHIAKHIQFNEHKVKLETDALIADLGVKNATSKDVLKKLVELAAKVALQVKRYPAELYLTYNPALNYTPFSRRKFSSQVIYYWVSKEVGIESETIMRAKGAITKPRPDRILYFPELMLKMKQSSGHDRAIIRQAEYG